MKMQAVILLALLAFAAAKPTADLVDAPKEEQTAVEAAVVETPLEPTFDEPQEGDQSPYAKCFFKNKRGPPTTTTTVAPAARRRSVEEENIEYAKLFCGRGPPTTTTTTVAPAA